MKTMKAISTIMMVVMTITAASITAFASDKSLSTRAANLEEKYYLTTGSLTQNGLTESVYEEVIGSLEKAFSHLDSSFMKTLVSYSSDSKFETRVTVSDYTYIGVQKDSKEAMDYYNPDGTAEIEYETDEYYMLRFPAKPGISMWAENANMSARMSITVNTNNGKIPTQDILKAAGKAFQDIVLRNNEGYTQSSAPQWYIDKYCAGTNSSNQKDREVAMAYMNSCKEIYPAVFARAIINGGDNPCSKDDEYSHVFEYLQMTISYNEHEMATGIYNDLVKIMGANCTAAQRMAGYIGI